MNILIDIGHPAHVHLFKHTARLLIQQGHHVWFTARRMPIIEQLMKAEGFTFRCVGGKHQTLAGKGLSVVHQTLWTIAFAWRHHIDVGLSSGLVQTIAALLSPMRAVVMDDDDSEVEPLMAHLCHPFCHTVLTPDAIKRKSTHACYYAGTHELAYLHPRWFKPDPTVLEAVGLRVGDPFFIMRFVAFHGHHDIGESGLTLEQKLLIAEKLAQHGRVIVSSEAALPSPLEPYRMAVPADKIHSLMAYASLYVGDSQTMTSESALLGVPALKCNTFSGRLSVPNMLEAAGLCMSFTPSQFDTMMRSLDALLQQPDYGRAQWIGRRDTLLERMIDVSSFVATYITDTMDKKNRH